MRILVLFLLLPFFGLSNPASGQDTTAIKALEKRIEILEEKLRENELEKLKSEAENLSSEKKEENKSKVFQSGQRSLQAINPEISVIGDAFTQYIPEQNTFRGEKRSGVYFRTLGMHIQSNLDPFSFTKIAIEFSPGGVEFGEAYITWTNAIPSVNITAGKFRQQFGVVNRLHVHALDQFDFPLPLTNILGEEGLNQIGFSFDWLMPSITADANQLTLQFTNGENDRLFAGELFSFPVTLLRFKNYYDLNRNTYFEVGFTGMMGLNNLNGVLDGKEIAEPTRWTRLGGIDMTLVWEPVNQSHYHSLTWRSELYFVDKEMVNQQKIKAFGGYTYFNYKLSQDFEIGARFDYTQPFEVNNNGKYEFQTVPYITWIQSHWVKIRLQYNYLTNNYLAASENTFRLQFTWAAGPHKHDRY